MRLGPWGDLPASALTPGGLEEASDPLPLTGTSVGPPAPDTNVSSAQLQQPPGLSLGSDRETEALPAISETVGREPRQTTRHSPAPSSGFFPWKFPKLLQVPSL